jgi:hypothetical protein
MIVAAVVGAPLIAAVLFLTLVAGYSVIPDPKPTGREAFGEVSPTSPTLLVIVAKPIPAYTPGTINPAIGLGQLCPHLDPGWEAARRTLGAADRRRVMASYGIADPGRVSEWDHLIPRSLGGADTISNIWPMTDRTQDQRKDQLENRLHRQVCAGTIRLATAQDQARTYWEHW